jgi:hypothetical protein
MGFTAAAGHPQTDLPSKRARAPAQACPRWRLRRGLLGSLPEVGPLAGDRLAAQLRNSLPGSHA